MEENDTKNHELNFVWDIQEHWAKFEFSGPCAHLLLGFYEIGIVTVYVYVLKWIKQIVVWTLELTFESFIFNAHARVDIRVQCIKVFL